MRMRRSAGALAFFVLFGGGWAAGCDSWFEHDKPTAEKEAEQRKRDEQTRDQVAKAVENAKPIVQEAGKKIGEAARSAADTAKSAAEGAKQGWERGKDAPMDLNSASESDLTRLPGISERNARRIVEQRPYKYPHEIVSKGIVTEDEYSRIKDAVTTK
jgi:DNA uptake protein ComE-like DNA-binding protein